MDARPLDALIPNCECHGEPMWWNRDSRYKKGGFWRCRVKDRERMRRRYAADPEHDKQKNRDYWNNLPNDKWRRANFKRRYNERAQRLRETERRLAESG